MTLQTLNCPSCGAPLRFVEGQARTLCLYCGSTIQTERAATVPAATTATFSLPEDVHAQLKQLVVDGRQAEAIELYRVRAGVTEAEAVETLSGLVRDLTRRTLVQQPLSNLGLAVMLTLDTVCAGLIVWGVLTENWWLTAIGLGLIVIETLAFGAAIYARLVQQFGRSAPAVVRRFTRLGEIQLRGQSQSVPVVRLWLEVQPPGQPAFQAERNIVAKPETYAKLRPGLIIEVKHNQAGHVIPTTPMKVLE
jgi:hypothetical protein